MRMSFNQHDIFAVLIKIARQLGNIDNLLYSNFDSTQKLKIHIEGNPNFSKFIMCSSALEVLGRKGDTSSSILFPPRQ